MLPLGLALGLSIAADITGMGALAALAAGQTGALDAAPRADLLYRQALHMRDQPEKAGEAIVQFRQAADHWLALSNDPSATLLRLAGQARFLAGDLPEAILRFRQAVRKDPADAQAWAALATARQCVRYPTRPEWADPLRPGPDPAPVAWSLARAPILALALYAGFWLATALAVITRRRVWLGLTLGCGLGLLPLLAGSARLWRQERLERLQPLAVIAHGVECREGNGPDFPARWPVPLPPGVETRLLAERGDWVQIETGGGVVGWVPRSAVRLEPPTPAS